MRLYGYQSVLAQQSVTWRSHVTRQSGLQEVEGLNDSGSHEGGRSGNLRGITRKMRLYPTSLGHRARLHSPDIGCILSDRPVGRELP
jgi:hypothetical protein